jgi:cytochrome oxidase assembly protein ShyY1
LILLPLPSVSAQENRIYELGLWDLKKEKDKKNLMEKCLYAVAEQP